MRDKVNLSIRYKKENFDRLKTVRAISTGDAKPRAALSNMQHTGRIQKDSIGITKNLLMSFNAT